MSEQATTYRVELRGRLDVEWLQSFDSSVEILTDETGQTEGLTVLKVHTDQSGIVGLLRNLHGLGMTILGLQRIAGGGQAARAGE